VDRHNHKLEISKTQKALEKSSGELYHEKEEKYPIEGDARGCARFRKEMTMSGGKWRTMSDAMMHTLACIVQKRASEN
jgi:hypothetical protein